MVREEKALLKIITYKKVDIYTPRIENRIGLREMCRKLDIDASNYSKMERGLLPISPELYERICTILKANPKTK